MYVNDTEDSIMNDWDRNNELAKFLRKRRKDAGLTQVELADITGVGLRFIRDWEQGKPNLMTDKVNEVLAFFGHYLGVKPIER